MGLRVGLPENPVTPRRHIGPDLGQGMSARSGPTAGAASHEPCHRAECWEGLALPPPQALVPASLPGSSQHPGSPTPQGLRGATEAGVVTAQTLTRHALLIHCSPEGSPKGPAAHSLRSPQLASACARHTCPGSPAHSGRWVERRSLPHLGKAGNKWGSGPCRRRGIIKVPALET